MFFRLIILFVSLLTFTVVVSQEKSCTKTNCVLPCCQCAVRNKNPTSLNVTAVPQLILLTFVGNLNSHTYDPIRSILNPSHRNPNKCPISATFFVNDNYTDYCLVQRLFDNHNEIAMTTSSNRCPLTNCYDENHWRPWIENDWKREIKQQRSNIIDQSRIHRSHVKGFRVPHLEIDENRHFPLIRNYHFHYDSSMLFKSSNLLWPFTMNFPLNQNDCVNCQGEIPPIDSLWQFPLHEWIYPNVSTACRTFSDSSCLPEDQSHSADLYFELLKFNFERHTSIKLGQRSPFIIELDLFWLSDEKHQRLEGLMRFIEFLQHSPDHQYVYFVSIDQALEWLKYPRSLEELDQFWAFSCSDTIFDYDIDCSNVDLTDGKYSLLTKEELARLKSTNGSNSTDTPPMDRRAEELFRSGIVLHSIWIFFILIISVLFYDKYFTSK